MQGHTSKALCKMLPITRKIFNASVPNENYVPLRLFTCSYQQPTYGHTRQTPCCTKQRQGLGGNCFGLFAHNERPKSDIKRRTHGVCSPSFHNWQMIPPSKRVNQHLIRSNNHLHYKEESKSFRIFKYILTIKLLFILSLT